MMNNSSDSCSRQLSQLHKELRVSRQEEQLLQGQLDTALANLQRKREKKRHYKVALMEETAQLQGALLHKDVRIAELNHRVDKVTPTLLCPAFCMWSQCFLCCCVQLITTLSVLLFAAETRTLSVKLYAADHGIFLFLPTAHDQDGFFSCCLHMGRTDW